MRINKKAIKLIDKGLTANTVGKLTESQINTLYNKILVSEQITEVPSKKTYKVGPKGGSLPPNPKGYSVRQDPSTKEVIATAAEGEVKETKNKNNPWSICTSQLGSEFGTKERHLWNSKQKNKYERCVKSVKKTLEEEKKLVSSHLETQIHRIVEKHLPPRITKGDLIKHLVEQGTTTAPTKPVTKPTTKPTTRPAHPGKNPNPGVDPAPKAKKISPDEAKDKVIDVILNLIKK